MRLMTSSPPSPSRWWMRAGILLLTWLVAGCDSGTSTPEPTAPAPAPLRVGAYFWPGEYWVDIAHHDGEFKKAGVEIEWVDTNADYFGSFDALVEGKLDIVCFTLYDLMLYRARGHDVVGFLAADISNGAEALITRPGVARVEELAGKKLGVSQGTYLEYLWTVAAGRAGLDPGAARIVDIVAEKAAEELSSGRVDAVLTWEPYASDARRAVSGRALYDTAQTPGASWAVYATRGDVVRERAAELERFVRVWVRTGGSMRANPDAAYATVAAVNKQTPDAARDLHKLDKILDLRDNLVAFSYAPGFDSLHGTARQMNDFQISHGVATVRVDTSALFDSRFVRAQGNAAPNSGELR